MCTECVCVEGRGNTSRLGSAPASMRSLATAAEPWVPQAWRDVWPWARSRRLGSAPALRRARTMPTSPACAWEVPAD